MKKVTLYTSIFLASALLMLACKKEKPELGISDQDPCGCVSEVSAEFTIEEITTYIVEDIWIETDTLWNGGGARFTAKEENATYKWYIGSQVFTTRSVFRSFPPHIKDVNIPITLVVTKNPNSICYPNDDGYDSIVKTFYIVDSDTFWNEDQTERSNWPTMGIYRMISPEHQDSFDMKIRLFKDPILWSLSYVTLENWDGQGNDCISMSKVFFGSSYRFLAFQESGNSICHSLTGTIIRPMNGPAELKMRSQLITSSGVNVVHYHYKGRRLF